MVVLDNRLTSWCATIFSIIKLMRKCFLSTGADYLCGRDYKIFQIYNLICLNGYWVGKYSYPIFQIKIFIGDQK